MSEPIQPLCSIKCELHVYGILHDVFILPALAVWPVTVMTTVLGEYENNCLLWFTQQLLHLVSQYYTCWAPSVIAQWYTYTAVCSTFYTFVIYEFVYVLFCYDVFVCLSNYPLAKFNLCCSIDHFEVFLFYMSNILCLMY